MASDLLSELEGRRDEAKAYVRGWAQSDDLAVECFGDTDPVDLYAVALIGGHDRLIALARTAKAYREAEKRMLTHDVPKREPGCSLCGQVLATGAALDAALAAVFQDGGA